MRIGEIIKYLREEKGWTQTEFSSRSGVPQNTISRIEKYMMPFYDTACKLFDALGVSSQDVWELMQAHAEASLNKKGEDMLRNKFKEKEKRIQRGDG